MEFLSVRKHNFSVKFLFILNQYLTLDQTATMESFVVKQYFYTFLFHTHWMWPNLVDLPHMFVLFMLGKILIDFRCRNILRKSHTNQIAHKRKNYYVLGQIYIDRLRKRFNLNNAWQIFTMQWFKCVYLLLWCIEGSIIKIYWNIIS